MHPKLEPAYAALPTPQNEDESVRIATLRGLLFGYHHRWLKEQWQVAVIEEEFQAPILNPDSGRPSRTFQHAGKVDGIVARNGENYLLEHKTCSEDVSADALYWKRLTIDTQISSYLLACWVLGLRLHGVLYDVIRKPEIRPKKLSGQERRDVCLTHSYCGFPLPEDACALCLADPNGRETAAMFERRLRRDTLSRPDWYFARRIVRRLDQELLAYARELWQTAEEIRQAMRLRDYRRNDRACLAFGRACEYLDLCAGHDRLESPTWKTLDSIHPELEEIADGEQIITHTRIACFTTCRRKHHYRYELGISRWEEAEPLVFGTLLHTALAAWWAHQAVQLPGERPQAAGGDGTAPAAG